LFETVIYEVRKQVAYITLNRPDKLNAFTEQLNKEIKQATQEAAKNPDVRAIVLTGAGRAFCSGEDLAGVTEQMDHGEVLRNRYNPMLREINKCEKPIIAAVNGVAVCSHR